MLRLINGILLIVLALWTVLLATRWALPYNYSVQLIQGLQNYPLQSILYALVLLSLGIWLLIRKQPNKIKPLRLRPIQLNLHTGRLRIDHDAIDDMIEGSISEVPGVSKSRFSFEIQADGLVISIQWQPNEGYDVELVAEKIRQIVHHHIDEYLGLHVKEVKVLVMPQRFGLTAWKK